MREPLFRKLEERYREEEESEMEKRKRRLAELRQMKGVKMNHEEIIEHAKKMEELAKEKSEERRKIREERSNFSYDASKYHNKFMESILEEEALQRESLDRRDDQRREAQDKRDVFDKYVKEMHWPKVSEKKKLELAQL